MTSEAITSRANARLKHARKLQAKKHRLAAGLFLAEGEDLVEDAIVRLVPQRRVLAYPYKGYWCPADTVKERAHLEDMYEKGNCPWMVWDPERSGQVLPTAPASDGRVSGVPGQTTGLIG